jgi:hypothetical protein
MFRKDCLLSPVIKRSISQCVSGVNRDISLFFDERNSVEESKTDFRRSEKAEIALLETAFPGRQEVLSHYHDG